MNNFLWCPVRCFFVINFSGKLRNFGEPKMGGVAIVVVVFISIKTLGPGCVKNYWACARLFPPPFERGYGWVKSAANSSPVKRPVDWAVPDDCARHAACMREDLLSST
jgi:hypothetical protein